MTIALIVLSVAWGIALFVEAFPLLRLPLARRKRELIVTMAVVVTISLFFALLAREQLHLFTGFLLLCSCIAASVIFVLLKRIDYYLDDLLREIFLLIVTACAIVMVSSLWYWGIAQPTISLLLLRVITSILPVLALVAFWVGLREDHTWWMIGVYVVLLVVKTILFPLWGVWTVILVMLYAILVGYILHWMAETTHAEKVLAWNISPSKVWILVALSAGVLVLVF